MYVPCEEICLAFLVTQMPLASVQAQQKQSKLARHAFHIASSTAFQLAAPLAVIVFVQAYRVAAYREPVAHLNTCAPVREKYSQTAWKRQIVQSTHPRDEGRTDRAGLT